MTEPEHTDEQDGDRASVGSRIGAWLGAVALLLIVLVLFMHVFAPTIASDEASPAGHPQSACIACHMVTGPTGEVEAK